MKNIEPEKILIAVDGLKGITHETRLTILCHLVQGSATVNQLVEITGAQQSSVSQHLTKMMHAGWITFDREGSKKHYRLINSSAAKLLDALSEIFCQ